MRARPSRRRVRWLFAVVVAALVAQLAYAYAFEEPYPSFLFPGFSGVPDDNGPVRVLRPRLVVATPDGALDVSFGRLFARVPGFVADAITYTAFTPPSSSAHPRSSSERFRAFLKDPRVALGDEPASGVVRDPRTIAWLRRRLAALYPRMHPQAVDVLWDQHLYVVHRRTITETVTTVATMHVSLER
jgi:hypothetical protein